MMISKLYFLINKDTEVQSKLTRIVAEVVLVVRTALNQVGPGELLQLLIGVSVEV